MCLKETEKNVSLVLAAQMFFLLFYEVTKSMLEKKVRLLNLLEFTLKIVLHTFQLVLDTSILPVK